MKFIPSIGVGGHCIPIDPEYLVDFAEQNGVSSKLISTANQVNIERPFQVVKRIERYLNFELSGKSIQVVGISYKPGVSDIRESPALELIKELRKLGASVCWFDPLVNDWLNEKSTPLNSAIDLGLIVTPHTEIDFSIWRESGTRVLDLSVTPQSLGWPRIL
jgi:UDP-N-acetyl-D-glucosamine dehydrogenase